MSVVKRLLVLFALVAGAWTSLVIAGGAMARADLPPISDEAILGRREPIVVESLLARYTYYAQDGLGYQSKAGPIGGPGSEWLHVHEPQVEVVLRQGDRIRHRLWVPVDIVTAASPVTKPDVVSAASRYNQAGALDWTTTYRATRTLSLSMREGVHLERMFRSYLLGLAASFASDDEGRTFTVGVTQANDWFDIYDVTGKRHGHANRSNSTLHLALTQALSETTIGEVNYGLTLQAGELGNTWGAVPLVTGVRGDEAYPRQRLRHALVGRLAQFLPWNGAARIFGRFYADSFGIDAFTMELELLQRLSRIVYVRASYRAHVQTGAGFFTTLAAPGTSPVTADSDLQTLGSRTLGAKIAFDIPTGSTFLGVRTTHVDVAYERYFRTNDLHVDVISCALGFRF